MLLRFVSLCLALMLGSFCLHAQQNTMKNRYEKEWTRVDSLMDDGLPASAAKIAGNILRLAGAAGDSPNAIKAQLFLLGLEADTAEHDEDGLIRIKRAERFLSGTKGVEQAVWQSITASLYQAFFEENRWSIYQRSRLSGTRPVDIATWDAQMFSDRIAELFLASVADEQTLQQVPVAQYAPLLKEGYNTRKLRPTMYDLLAFRAIDFFKNDEKELTRAADHFRMEGAVWFDAAPRFSELRVKVKDGSALHFRALQLYQDVIAFHLRDAQPDALIDADLQRLDFVLSYSVHPTKDSLYLAALRYLEERYTGHKAVAEVSYKIAERQMVSKASGVQQQGAAIAAKPGNLPAVARQLEQIVARYPGSEGAAHAADLLHSLRQVHLAVQVEEVNVPGEQVKALIRYRNQSGVRLRLYRIANALKDPRIQEEDEQGSVAGLEPLRSWEQALPASQDMDMHSTEISLGSLAPGAYRLLAMSGDAKDDDSVVTATVFQVSSLSIFLQNDKEVSAVVLDRSTGKPVSGVKARFWTEQYNQQTRAYERKLLGEGTSAAGGKLSLPAKAGGAGSQALRNITLVNGKDTLQLTGYFNFYNYVQPDQAAERTFFFTDRSLYRPGQTIWFKGISLRSSNKGRDNTVMAGRKSKVTLYDANGQEVQSLALTTNEYGSFSGSFTAPEGGLTGYMRIGNDNGSAGFSVEEYKRPKFYTSFDTVKGSYSLDRQVTVRGRAAAYAGNNIDGAAVTYRVVRRARFPYYWSYYRWGMPASPEVEVTNGTARTDADGSFEITFQTLPDLSVDPVSMPVFSFTVYADVTDINGETRSSTTTVQAGYRSLQLKANVPEQSRPEQLQELSVRSENLNGAFVPVAAKLRIAPLKFPGFRRKRLWDMPDQFVLSEDEFRKAFPRDEYKNESNYMSWEEGAAVFEKELNTGESGKVNIPLSAWAANGWYVVTIQAKDPEGRDITEKKYTYVWAPGRKQPEQRPLVIATEKGSYQPGDKLEVWHAAAVADPYLLATIYRVDGVQPAGREQNPFRYTLAEADRGGMAFRLQYLYDNRIYTAVHRVEIPWSNKDLQLEWATHRDKLQPGAAEQWTLTIKGDKKDKVAAELLAGMYDASLDAYSSHQWQWERLFPSVMQPYEAGQHGFGTVFSRQLSSGPSYEETYRKEYDLIDGLDDITGGNTLYFASPSPRHMRVAEPGMMADSESALAGGKMKPSAVRRNEEVNTTAKLQSADVAATGQQNDAPVTPRRNLNETAFFFPQVATDGAGNVQLKFTMPEALTEWKLMAFAHTKEWQTGYLEGKVKTQKDLMVVPNMPRFLRQNDDIVISARINNLSDKTLNGNARIELLDAVTMKSLDVPFRLQDAARTFGAASGQGTQVSWSLHVPESSYNPVLVRITARAGDFSDGEENALPVVTNRMLVTETLPLAIRGNAEQQFSLPGLLQPGSNTMSQHGLTVEFTGNPAWYAVQALPYLMEYPYECAEQTFNRFYANALAGHIVAQSPGVAKIFEQWQQRDTAALLSNLQKNQELKSALLEETPWVMEARNETEQKRRIALLFATHKLSKELKANAAKLSQMQLGDGSFPWFKGMSGDRYITQYILTGIGRLQRLGVSRKSSGLEEVAAKGIAWLDGMLKADYEALIRDKADLNKQHVDYLQVQYLYMRSFFSKEQPIPADVQKAYSYYERQAAQYFAGFNPYLKAQLALSQHRNGNKAAAGRVLASLRETAVSSSEMGTYWKEMSRGYRWYEAPIEAQAQLIEAFQETGADAPMIDAMKVWLLKQKQTQNWSTTKATADACYALLLSGTDWLAASPEVTIRLGDEVVSSSAIPTEAGTGYFKKSYSGPAVKPAMGNISVRVAHAQTATQGGVSWGAVYWQYFEDLDKIKSAATPLGIRKQLFVERNTEKGPVLTEISEGGQLHVGDKVKVRIELRVDRNMEYVHLKDMRAACMEPVNVLSGYRYQAGLGYYESTRDLSTSFFFDYLPKGVYVFEYPVFVAAKGDFSNGITTAQCMYAPEFSSHSEGVRVRVD